MDSNREVDKNVMPLKLGGLRALLAILALPTSFFMVNFLFLSPDMFRVIFSLSLGFFIACLLLLMSFDVDSRAGLNLGLSWFSQYKRRNIIGYSRCYWIDKEGKVEYKNFRHFDQTNNPLISTNNPLISITFCPAMIEVPLGGWFNRRPKLWVYDNKTFAPREILRAKRWGRADAGGIRIIDNNGQPLKFGIKEALLYLKWMRDDTNMMAGRSWLYLIGETRRCAENTEKQSRQAREDYEKRIKEKNRLFSQAVMIIQEAICRISNTSRLGKSKEARKIRLWLLDEMSKLVEPSTAAELWLYNKNKEEAKKKA